MRKEERGKTWFPRRLSFLSLSPSFSFFFPILTLIATFSTLKISTSSSFPYSSIHDFNIPFTLFSLFLFSRFLIPLFVSIVAGGSFHVDLNLFLSPPIFTSLPSLQSSFYFSSPLSSLNLASVSLVFLMNQPVWENCEKFLRLVVCFSPQSAVWYRIETIIWEVYRISMGAS